MYSEVLLQRVDSELVTLVVLSDSRRRDGDAGSALAPPRTAHTREESQGYIDNSLAPSHLNFLHLTGRHVTSSDG